MFLFLMSFITWIARQQGSAVARVFSQCAKKMLAGAVFFVSAISVIQAAETADLRGYGKVIANLAANKGVFECESVQKADILLDKLQADLFWDQMLPVKTSEMKLGPASVTIYSLPGYGSTIIARSGDHVIVLGGVDEKDVRSLARNEPLLKELDVTSKANTPHPRYLDMYDNRAFKTYDIPMGRDGAFGRESRWPFMKSIGGSMAFFSPNDQEFPAPGVLGLTQMDYEVREAERQGESIMMLAYGGGGVPRWVADLNPESIMRPSDSTSLSAWGGAFSAGAAYESWCTPMAQRVRSGIGILIQYMQRYGSSPAIGAWSLSCGAPGLEYAFHDRPTRTWDTSPVGQDGWRRWLKEERHWSLADLGKRWHADPKHFARWEDVRVPDPNIFFGQYGTDTYDISTNWRWKHTTEPSGGPLSAATRDWVPINRPPSQQQSFLSQNRGINHFDVTFDASPWLKTRREGANLWLVFGIIGAGKDAVQAWLNDKPVVMPTDVASKDGPFAVRVTGLLKAGSNHLQVALQCSQTAVTCGGTLAGPVFLTSQEPRRFPWLGRQANALYVDMLDWQCWAITDYHRQALNIIRKLDPDRPLLISGGGGPLIDETCQLAVDYGVGVENTGREASYIISSPGLGAGFYATSEWSNLTGGSKLNRGIGFILFDADASHCLWGDLEYYRKLQPNDGWFTPQHRRQINLFGKYLREQPKAALLRSAKSARFAPAQSGLMCIDWGELQAAHYDHAVLTERTVKNGQAAQYPLMIDTVSRVMEPEMVKAIRTYVENGGTFVCVPGTAHDTITEPDSYPLATLSGFKVIGPAGNGTIKFESNLPIFKGWEGKEFAGRGRAIDWQNANYAEDIDRLQATDPAAVVLARWTDGSVAIGYRQIGKGRIIVLGTTFWRQSQDLNGIWRSLDPIESEFLSQLMTDCGVSRNADATVPEIWARKMVTKNGLQNWLMAFNSTPDVRIADVWMQTDETTDQVIDQETGESVPFAVENHGVRIKDVRFAAYEVKVFAVRRGTLASGLPVWWSEKKTYWVRTPVQLAAQKMALPERKSDSSRGVIPLDTWRFQTDLDRAVVKQGDWTAIAFNDASWKVTGGGPWNLFDPDLKDYHGTGLYRAAFNLRPLRAGQRVLLHFFDRDSPIVFDTGIFHVNGTQVATYQAHGWSQTYSYDVTPLIKSGANVVALEAVSGAKLGGLRGNVWIETWEPLTPALDLAGAWQAIQGDWLTRIDAIVPGSAHGKYLTRSMQIPADWKGRSVYVEWSTGNQWVGTIVINGMPINNNNYAHPYGPWARVNVTSFLRPGEDNVIEIWPFATMSQGMKSTREEQDGLHLDTIRIGCR